MKRVIYFDVKNVIVYGVEFGINSDLENGIDVEVFEMFGEVLFATDFSKTANEITRAIPDSGIERVYLIHVVDVNPVVGLRRGFDLEEWLYSEIETACRKLSSIAEHLESRGVHARFVCPVPVGDPATEIVNAAKRLKVSAILVGCRGRSVNKDILLGSVAEGVVRRADVPVMIAKNPKLRIERVLFVHSESDFGISGLFRCAVVYVLGRKYDFPRNGDRVVFGGENAREILRCADEEGVDAIVLCGLNVTTDAVIRHSKVTVVYFPQKWFMHGNGHPSYEDLPVSNAR